MTNINGLRTPEWEGQKADFSKWSTGFDDLSEDPLGIRVFESYLSTEGYLQYLEFLWACEGMRNIGHKQSAMVPQIVSCIYRHYILSGVLNNSATEPILNRLGKSTGGNASQQSLSYNEMADILNDLKIRIDSYVRNEIYPKFLTSSILLEAKQKYCQQSFHESHSLTETATNATHCEPKISGVKMEDSAVAVPNLYHRKIIFVLNNDDLPTHQTLITTTGNLKQKANDPENFVKELTEKLQLLKIDQEREEENHKKVEAYHEAERATQRIFCNKITEALNQHIGKERSNNTDSSKCSNFNSEGTTKKLEGQTKSQNIEKIYFSCHKRRIKSCLQHFTLFKSTRKFRAKFPKCGKYSINSCMRQKDGSQVSKYLTRSRSLNFSDSDPEFSEVSYAYTDRNKKRSREAVPHSSSYPLSMDRIQNWMNESKKDFRDLDTVNLLK